MNKKKAIFAPLAAALILIFAACSNSNDGSTLLPNSFAEALKTLPNVESVQELNTKSDFKGTVYKVYFNSLLDPSDSSKGTFRQKAYIGFAGYDKPNCLMTTGYSLSDYAALARYSENEAAFILQGNLIAVEHRYFGESVRTDKKRSDGADYWEYLNTKNAAEDLHAIVSKMKTFLKGKWVAQGASKGGLTANLLCYYHPEDVDVTMPYVAPLCNAQADTRLFKFVYTEAGDKDSRYNSSGSAAEYRELLTNIQIWLLEKRDQPYEEGKTFKEKYIELSTPASSEPIPPALADFYYEMSIGAFPMGVWQYKDVKGFADLKTFYNLPNDNDESTDSDGKRQSKKSFLLSEILDDSGDDTLLPYVFQSFCELGNYRLDFSYLRQAIAAKGSSAKITIAPDQEMTAYQTGFSDAERALFAKYTPAIHDNLINWINTTDEQVIMIYGNSDPWYSVRIPDVSRDNVHIFVHPANNHNSMIANFPEAQRNEMEALLRQYLY